MMGLGLTERSLTLVDRAMNLNPHHPGWYHLVPYLFHYSEGRFDEALTEAEQFNTPVFYVDPLIRAAALGQLGHQRQAQQVLDELLAVVPDFASRGRDMIRRIVFHAKHVDRIWDGYEKAGLE